MNAIKTVGVIGKSNGIIDALRSLVKFLQENQCKVILDQPVAKILNDPSIEGYSREQIGKSCDLCVVIGGDGTMLNAARSMVDHDVPLVGVNLGRLGFLADISPADLIGNMEDILAGKYTTEERILLYSTIVRNGEIINQSNAFNDVVLHRSEVGRMIEVEICVNGKFINNRRSDGLIVSTPTGSTAYALSGGGPLMYPMLDAVVIVPICPHTLSQRPIVMAMNADTEIEIFLHDENIGSAQVTCDGQIKITLEAKDRIIIKRKEKFIRLIHPPGYDYFDILRAKLRWADKL